MRSLLLTPLVSLALLVSGPASAQSAMAGITHSLSVVRFALHLETRLGPVDCELAGSGSQQEILDCRNEYGQVLTDDQLAGIGLIKRVDQDR